MELLLVLVPLVVTILFRRTPLGWVPGLVLVLASIVCFAQGDSGGHGEPAVIGSGWGPMLGMVALIYALICLAIASSGRSKPAAAAPPAAVPPFMVVAPPPVVGPLPPATVVHLPDQR